MRPSRVLLPLLFFVIAEQSFGQEVPACDAGEEFSIEVKRCIRPISGTPCPDGRARYLGFCAQVSELRLNSELEVPENIRSGLLETARRQIQDYDQTLAVAYQAHLTQEAARIAAEAAAEAARAPIEPTPAPAVSDAPIAGPEPEAEGITPTPLPEVTDNQDELEESFSVFDPDQCEWVPDMPRKIHEAPGCRRSSRTKVCVGYVSCRLREGEGKFIRASTCSTQYCGDSAADASACTKDPGFWSSHVDESSPKYLGREIRNLINRASAQ